MTYVSPKPYPYLPEGRQIKYVPLENQFLQAAKIACEELSTDKQHGTGAVIVREGEILGRGANQGNMWFHKKFFCVRRLLNIPSGKMYWLCPGCAKFKDHAEAMAIKNVKAKGQNAKDADLYLYGHWWCCKPCWDKMIAAGIKDVYLAEGASELFSK